MLLKRKGPFQRLGTTPTMLMKTKDLFLRALITPTMLLRGKGLTVPVAMLLKLMRLLERLRFTAWKEFVENKGPVAAVVVARHFQGWAPHVCAKTMSEAACAAPFGTTTEEDAG